MTTYVSSETELLRQLGDLKRMRVAHRPGSLAQHLFEDAYAALAAGEEPQVVAYVSAARAVALLALGGVSHDILCRGGLTTDAADATCHNAFDSLAFPLPGGLRATLRTFAARPMRLARVPDFARRLAAQPRAGATMPGKPRLMLDPTESHADHCALVAVYAVLLSSRYGANPAEVFLTGIAHHLHNADMPDGGFAGEERLGADLAALCTAFRNVALSELEPPVRALVEPHAMGYADASTPEARAFHAADVLDRVLQQAWHAEAASFSLRHALHEMEIVHAGPVQAFHRAVLLEAGIL